MAVPGKPLLVVFATCLPALMLPREVIGGSLAHNIATDGSLGPAAVTLTGPSYAITASLGKQVGGNLFHSFAKFGLATKETATFSGPTSVTNVIGRVTGGNASSIDGTIKSAIAGANLYLINPNGIVFGPNSSVNISGSFHATTADYLKMADGAKFQATNPSGSRLSAAPPVAFGFLTPSPAKITVNGSTLGPVPGTLGLVGGPVTVTGGTLQAPGAPTAAGTIHIASAAATGEVPVDPRSTAGLTVSRFGPVQITGRSTLDVRNSSNPGPGGSVFIHAGALRIEASEINADNYGVGAGGQIVLRGDSGVTLTDAADVHAVSMSTGNGADVMIATAQSAAISADAAMVQTGSVGTGNGGRLSVDTGQLVLTNGAGFSSLAQGAGNGGSIAITARSVRLDINPPVDPNTGLFSPVGVFSDTLGAGHGGSIAITAGQLTLHNGASVLAQSDAAGVGGSVSLEVGGALTINSGASLGTLATAGGNAGDVSVHAGQVTVDMSTGFQSILLGVGSWTIGQDAGSGNAGNVSITANSLTIQNNASVSSLTLGAGNSGRLNINISGPLSVGGPTSDGIDQDITSAGILGGSFGSGNAGTVAVTAGELSIVAGGLIASDAFADGNAGSVSANVAGGLTIDAAAAPSSYTGVTGITAEANPGSTGSAGDVSVNAGGVLSIVNLGEISSDTFNLHDAGHASVTAGSLSIINGGEIVSNSFGSGNAGGLSVKAGSISLADSGMISSGAVSTGSGGQVTVSAGTLSITSNGAIASGTLASGKGGNIAIDVDGVLTIDGAGGIAANLTGISALSEGSGDAGAVAVTAGELTIAHNGLISSSTAGLVSSSAPKSGNGGEVSITVDGQLTIDGSSTDPSLPTGIVANSYAGGTGDAGNVAVTAGSLVAIAGGSISSALQTFNPLQPGGALPASKGNAGSVAVKVGGPLTVTGTGSRIGVQTTPGAIGSAGTIAVTASRIAVTDNAQITSATFGSGPGGSVSVDTGTLSVTTGGLISAAAFGSGPGGDVSVGVAGEAVLNGGGVDADARSTGNAGTVDLSAAGLSIANGGFISSATFASGNAGDVSVAVGGPLTVTSDGYITTSTIASGNAGDIMVAVGGPLSLTGGGLIFSTTSGPGNGGDVAVMGQGPVMLAGIGAIGSPGGIAASALDGSSGNAGSISLSGSAIMISAGASVESETAGTGAGGSVVVTTPGALAIDGLGNATTGIAASAIGAQSGPAGSVDVAAGTLSLGSGAQIASSTASPGRGGDVMVRVANDAMLAGLANDGTPTRISAASLGGSTGRAGQVTLTSGGALTLADGAEVSSSTAGIGDGGSVEVSAQGPLSVTDPGSRVVASSSAAGNAGAVAVTAPTITLNDGARIASTASGTGAGGSVVVTTPGALILDGEGDGDTAIAASATGPQSGAAGSVKIAADSLVIEGGALIASSAAGLGNGGSVDVTIGRDVTLSGVAADGTAGGITAAALPGSAGQAGQVVLTAGGMITVAAGAEVTSSTAGVGNGGSVQVTARGPLMLTDPKSRIAAVASSTATGNAGSVAVNAPLITLASGGAIVSTTAGTGAGGAVTVTTPGALLLDGQGNVATQIAASALGANSGSGGDVTVKANSLTVDGGAEIASSTAGLGRGGNVNIVVASDIVLPDPGPQISARSTGSGDAGSITVSAMNLRLNNGATISTEALTSTANGGNIALSIGDFLYLASSEITTSVKGETGNGGNITIDPDFLILNHSSIIAQAVQGHGGNISITAGVFIPSADSIVSASSELGISGTVVINGPLVNLNGTLVVLSSELRGAVALTREACAARGNRPQSSLVEAGRGGLPQDPDATLPALYIAGRDLSVAPRRAAEVMPPPVEALQTAVHLTMRCGDG